MTNEEYMAKIYAILDEWSVLNSTNIEDVYDAMQEVERRLEIEQFLEGK